MLVIFLETTANLALISVAIALVRFKPTVAYVLQYAVAPMLAGQGALWMVFECIALLGFRLGLPS